MASRVQSFGVFLYRYLGVPFGYLVKGSIRIAISGIIGVYYRGPDNYQCYFFLGGGSLL